MIEQLEIKEPPTDVRHRGPSLLAVAIVFALLFVASIAGSMVMAGGDHYPSPYQAEALSTIYFTEHAKAVRLNAFLQFGAAVPLGIFTATAVSRLRFLRVKAAGTDIAYFGGVAASVMAALSALIMWMISWPEIAGSPIAHVLHVASFAIGGPGHVVPLGLLIAGVSVTGGVARLLPSWLTWFGILVAALAELSVFSLVLYPAAFLLPAARLLGFAWMICVGASLPKSRTRHRDVPLDSAEGSAQVPAPT
jgi:hypothetical protein